MTDSERAPEAPTPSPANMLLRGLSILEAVARSSSRRGAAVKEIAAETGLDKSTASRILAFLREAGYIRQDVYRRYRLTGKLSQLTAGYSDIEDLLGVARPHLEEMHHAFDEEVHLAVLDGGYMQFVDYIASSQVVRSNLSNTQRLIHETAAGRAALAPLGREERAEALERSAAAGQIRFSIAEMSALQDELDDARARGWAGHDPDDGVSRFAAPIIDATGHPVAAMCVSGPTFRVSLRAEEFAAAVVDAAAKTSRELRGETCE